MRVYCKKNCTPFIKGLCYNLLADYHSVFEYKDFISIKDEKNNVVSTSYRFRLNHSTEYIENYIGESEYYFYDYFCSSQEMRKMKLEHLSKIKL